MSVHEQAARGFEAGADAYERGRPDYPPDAVEWLIAEAGLRPGRVVVDVGAGTGKLTRALLASGAEVVAIEPVAGMRAVFEREVPEATVRNGVAEALPLEDASAEAVVVAQAFHWFDGPKALAEFHRVLRPGGRLGLIWNRRRLEEPLWRAITEIFDRYRGDTPSHASGDWRPALEASTLFAPAGEFTTTFELSYDEEQLVDRVVSTSFIAALDDAARNELAERLRRVAADLASPLVLGYTSEIFLYERRD